MIHSYHYCLAHVGEIGTVEQVKDFLVQVKGLLGAVVGEGVTFENEVHGRVMALDQDFVEVLVLSREPLKPQTKAARTGSLLTISAGAGILGHTLDTLGHSLTLRRQHSLWPEKRIIEEKPLGIEKRQRISQFFETGITVVDTLIPLGAGQRELVIGDRKIGKTHLLLSVMLSQAHLGNICIFCAIGKRKTEIKALEEFLKENKIWEKCVIVAADSHASPGEIYLAPYTAMTLAEYFRDEGKNVLLILDDLTTHAKYYREISLLSGRFPGRESYPGDIFHVQSKLLERAGCFNVQGKQVTITCLPVAESVAADLTGYIQTNLMSMTDGHIYLDSDIFFSGRRPAVNVFLSVTRVGRQTQNQLFRDLGEKVLSLLKKYEDAQRFLRFGPELSDEMKNTIRLGDGLTRFFQQTDYQPIPSFLRAVLFSLLWVGLWDGANAADLVNKYSKKKEIQDTINRMVGSAKSLEELNKAIEKEGKNLSIMLGTKNV